MLYSFDVHKLKLCADKYIKATHFKTCMDLVLLILLIKGRCVMQMTQVVLTIVVKQVISQQSADLLTFQRRLEKRLQFQNLYRKTFFVVGLTCGMDDHEIYKFGHCQIKRAQVFYKTQLSFAFVNIKPVLPGHILLFNLTKFLF